MQHALRVTSAVNHLLHVMSELILGRAGGVQVEGLRSSDLVPARQASPRTNTTGAPACSPGPWAMLQHATTGNTGDNADGFRRPLSPRWAPRAPPKLTCQVIGPAATGAGLGRALPSSLTQVALRLGGKRLHACVPVSARQRQCRSMGFVRERRARRRIPLWSPLGADRSRWAARSSGLGSVVATHRMCMNWMLDGSSMGLRNDGPSFSGTH